MAKKIVGNSSRKPPEPGSHAEIKAWSKRVMPDLAGIVKWLDETITDAIPDVQHALKWRKAYYGSQELGWAVELVAYDVSVNVVFLGGADFDEPPPLGETGRSRYVKLKTLEEAKAPEVRQWIQEAARTTGWK